jgi:hypothetical protein
MICIDEAIKTHISVGCNASFTKKESFGVLEIPENKLASKKKVICTYEIEDKKVNIYINGEKDHTIDCPTYAQRPLIAIDILIRMAAMGLNGYLLVLDSDEKLDENIPTKTAADTLQEPSERNLKLEVALYKALSSFFEKRDISMVKDNISEGFKIICNHYFGEIDEAENIDCH